MNKEEFTRRVLAAENRLYRIGVGMLQNRQDCMDAVQEAVLKAWTNLSRLRREEFFETWLTRILINECHNIQSRRGKIVSLERMSEQDGCTGENEPLRDAVAALDETLRLPVLLYYMEGYKVREVAQILNIPEGTVKTRLLRAKTKLKRLLEEEMRA